MEEAFLKLIPNPTGLYNIFSAHGNLMPKDGQSSAEACSDSSFLSLPSPPPPPSESRPKLLVYRSLSVPF